MVEISLKAYNAEIKSMIEAGQIEDAIAHCQHILQVYPKHVDTYRLLGEAYLEDQRYQEAADIFQRVLSTVPDDFESHIGMSILREEEESYDEAIWHMQRAFEIQPANNLLQTELNRLYSYREGTGESKVRLNRSALARMYIRGKLFPQAVAEIQSALGDDPNRLDLKLLLAEVLIETGDMDQAAASAKDVLGDLPDCLSANLILAEYSLQSGKNEEAQLYIQRLSEIDPYISFAADGYSPSEDIDESRITLERLDLTPVGSIELQSTAVADHVVMEQPESSEASLIEAAAAAVIVEQVEDSQPDAEAAGEEAVQPVQPSEWLQELEEQALAEDDTKPVPVATAALAGQAVKESVSEDMPSAEAEIEITTEEMPVLPDWLQELAEEVESTTPVEELQLDEAAIDASVDQADVAVLPETPHKAEEIEVAREMAFSDMDDGSPQAAVLARQHLTAGRVEDASEQYRQLIRSRKNLPSVISDLEEASRHFPDSVSIWQNLGDAYLRNRQMKEAMTAYSRVEALENS